MVAALQDDCDSTLHIVTETIGKLKKTEGAHACRLCGRCVRWGGVSDRSCVEELCGRCSFLKREDGSGLLALS